MKTLVAGRFTPALATALSLGLLTGCVDPAPSDPGPSDPSPTTEVVRTSVLDHHCDGSLEVYVISSAHADGSGAFQEQRFVAGYTGTLDKVVLRSAEITGAPAHASLYESSEGRPAGVALAELTVSPPVDAAQFELIFPERPSLEQGREYVLVLASEVGGRIVTHGTNECPGKGLTVVTADGPLDLDEGYDVVLSTWMTPA